MHTRIDACRVCGNSQLAPILDLGEQALTGVFPRAVDWQVESGPLRLVKCHGSGACGLVQLEHSFSSDQMYGDNYGYRSGLNQTMVRHLRDKVDRVLSRFEPPEGAVVLDIGSNDGTTLGAYPSDRFVRVGIDPTASKFLEYYPPDVQVVPDFFSEGVFRAATGDREASIVTSLAMFYDLESPLSFIRDIHNILTPDGIWIFEQSYLPSMLAKNSYDTVCHEHIEYYSLSQVAWMAEQVGFTLTDVEFNDINGGSFSVIAHKTGAGSHESSQVSEIIEREKALGIDRLELYASFADRVAHSRDSLLEFIADAHAANKLIGALGASTKGNVLLQYCGLTPNDVVAIGEVNEEKFGAFTPGSLIPIVPEDQLLAIRPEYLLVLPWHFRETFMSKRLEAPTRLVFPLPELEVVDHHSGGHEKGADQRDRA